MRLVKEFGHDRKLVTQGEGMYLQIPITVARGRVEENFEIRATGRNRVSN
jgi:hypothetical protein